MVVSPYLQGYVPRSPGGLKLQVVLNPTYTMFLPIRTFLVTYRKHFTASLWGIQIASNHDPCALGPSLNKIKATKTQAL